jgi:hypothetical protein
MLQRPSRRPGCGRLKAAAEDHMRRAGKASEEGGGGETSAMVNRRLPRLRPLLFPERNAENEGGRKGTESATLRFRLLASCRRGARFGMVAWTLPAAPQRRPGSGPRERERAQIAPESATSRGAGSPLVKARQILV